MRKLIRRIDRLQSPYGMMSRSYTTLQAKTFENYTTVADLLIRLTIFHAINMALNDGMESVRMPWGTYTKKKNDEDRSYPNYDPTKCEGCTNCGHNPSAGTMIGSDRMYPPIGRVSGPGGTNDYDTPFFC